MCSSAHSVFYFVFKHGGITFKCLIYTYYAIFVKTSLYLKPLKTYMTYIHKLPAVMILMGCYNHSISLDATIKVSKNAKSLVNMLLSFL